MKNISIITIIFITSVLTSCTDLINQTENMEEVSSKKYSQIQSQTYDEMVADSILTQVIGYVTETIDTVEVVDVIDIYIENQKKYIIFNCITQGTPDGHSIGIQYYDSTQVAGLANGSVEMTCVKVGGCPHVCGRCSFSVGGYPSSVCKCDFGTTTAGACGISKSGVDLLPFATTGANIRANVIIADIDTYEY